MLFYTKNSIILPTQARDRHRESTQKKCIQKMGVSQFSEYRIEAADRNGTVCVQVKRGASLFG